MLFNLLKAYSLYDNEIGYMQGMNFIAGLILMIFDEDEAMAWVVFLRVLEINEWKRLYEDHTPKLFEVAKILNNYIQKDLPKLYKHIQNHNLTLEPLIASPFMTLFSNLISVENSLKVLERFILIGEEYIIDTMKSLFKENQVEMLKMDQWDLQVFIGRKMY